MFVFVWTQTCIVLVPLYTGHHLPPITITGGEE